MRVFESVCIVMLWEPCVYVRVGTVSMVGSLAGGTVAVCCDCRFTVHSPIDFSGDSCDCA